MTGRKPAACKSTTSRAKLRLSSGCTMAAPPYLMTARVPENFWMYFSASTSISRRRARDSVGKGSALVMAGVPREQEVRWSRANRTSCWRFAEHDVHGDECGEDEDGLVGERFGEDLGRALKRGVHAGWQIERLHRGVDGGDCVAQGLAGCQIERQGCGGELPLVRDGRGVRRLLVVRDGGQRDRIAGGRAHVDRAQGHWILLERRCDLQDHAIQVELGEDGRDLALAEGIVERVVGFAC